MRNRKVLYAALFFIALAGFFSYLLVDANSQTGTPPLWLTSKHYVWQGGAEFKYYVTGYWWTDGPYWHKGDIRTFEVEFVVYNSVLVPNYRGYIDDHICILIQSEPYGIVNGYICYPSFEQLLPITQG